MIKVDLICDVFSPSGYSAHARELIRALCTCPEIDLRIVDHKHDTQSVKVTPEESNLFKTLLMKTRAPEVRIQFETPEFFVPEPNVVNIGFTQWETTRIPSTDMEGDPTKNWVTQMNRMDAMWTSCLMASEAFTNSGVHVPVHVLRGPVDTNMFMRRPEELPFDGVVVEKGKKTIPRAQRPPVIGMIAQWTPRKNVEALLYAALSYFKEGEIILLLKLYGATMDDSSRMYVLDRIRQIRDMVKNPNPPKICVTTEKLTDDQIARVYNSIDIYVSPSRGEGFCMPIVQAMACECFPISTDFSAPRDYISHPDYVLGPVVSDHYDETLYARYQKSNGFLVPCQMSPAILMPRNPWYRYDQEWAEIDIPALARAIKGAIDIRSKQPELFSMMCSNARKTVVDEMSLKAAGERAFDLILNAYEAKHAASS